MLDVGDKPAAMKELAQWMLDGGMGTKRIHRAEFDGDALLAFLGGSSRVTVVQEGFKLDGRVYKFRHAGSELLVSQDLRDTED